MQQVREKDSADQVLNRYEAKDHNRLLISELILLTIFALLSVAGKQMLRLDLNLPGHSYFLYIFFMVFGSSYIPKRGVALYMGIAAGIFAVVTGSKKGVLELIRFCAPALSIEFMKLFPTFGYPMVNRIFEGFASAMAMLIAKSALNLLTGKPLAFVLIKFYPGLVTYTVIGVACGVMAFYMERAVRRYKGES